MFRLGPSLTEPKTPDIPEAEAQDDAAQIGLKGHVPSG